MLIAAASGYDGENELWKSREASFGLHLVKPIRRATLEELLRSMTLGK